MPRSVFRRIKSFALCFALLFCLFHANAQDISPLQKSALQEEQDYLVAAGLLRDSLFQLAEVELESFLRTYPNSIHIQEVAFWRVECSFFLGRYEEAVAGYAQYVARYPRSNFVPKAYFRQGEALLRQKKYSKAVEAFKQILDKYPDTEYIGEAAYWIGESYAGAAEYQDALKYYRFSYEQGRKNRVYDYALYSLGWTYQKLGNYHKALMWYDSLRSYSQSDVLLLQACFRSAECYSSLKDFSAALTQIQKCRTIGGGEEDQAKVEFLIAEYFYQAGKYKEAQQQYEQFLQRYPENSQSMEARYGLAWSLSKQKEYRKALLEFSAIAGSAESPLSIPAKFEVGRLYRILQKNDSALAVYMSVAERAQQADWREKALLEAGVIYYEKGNVQKARECFQAIETRKATSNVGADARRWLGECFFAEKKYADAAITFERVAYDSTVREELRALTLYQAGRSYYLAKQYPTASEKFKMYLTLYPAHELASEGYYWLAESEYRRGNYTSALEWYTKIITQEKSPYRIHAYYGIGWSYYKLNQYNNAIQAFEKLLLLEPKGRYALDARLRIADAYYAQKDYKKAASSYRLAMRMFPDSAGIDYAAYQAGQSFYRMQDYSQAYASFEALVKMNPRSSYADDACYAMGYINLQQREFSDAIKDFQTLIQKFPQSDIIPKAYYSLGDCYYNLKNYSAARRAYAEILRRFPSHELASDAITALYYSLVAEQKESEIYQVIDEYLERYSDEKPAEKVMLKKAELLKNERKYEQALKTYMLFTERYPTSATLSTALFALAETHVEMNNTAKALETYGQMAANERIPQIDRLKARLKSAEIYCNSGNYQKAEENLKQCLLAADREVAAEAYTKLGFVAEAQGRESEALTLYENLVRTYPNAKPTDNARLALARLYVKRQLFSDAKSLLEQVSSTRKDTLAAEAYCALGDLALLENNPSAALKSYLRVKYLFPSDEEYLGRAYLGMGRAYEKMKNTEEARKMYNAILRLHVSRQLESEARKYLEQLQ